MSNLIEQAFPAEQSGHVITNYHSGFTKHEYAAIEMAKALAANYEYLPDAGEREQIAGVAYELAEKVLSYFK